LITMRKHVSNLESRLINVQSSDSASQSVAEENIALLRAQVSSSLLMCIRRLLFAAYLSIMP
jgi:hypothetical protein